MICVTRLHPFNESRGRNPGNTVCGGKRHHSIRAFNESRGRNPGNTRSKRRRSMRSVPFNESRGRNPGNTDGWDMVIAFPPCTVQ